MSTVLEIKQLLVRRDVPILHDIEWRVNRTEHWVILGPNGCGKTSLLAALTGYVTPTGGSITVLGDTYGTTDWRELRKKVGFVSNALTREIEPDEPGLHVVASGPEAKLNLWHPPTATERRRALVIMRRWKSTHLADRPWGVLSQGERQRLLIGRALLAAPPLLLLDEPCAGLDPIARENLLELVELESHRRRGPSLVLITHHVEEITPCFTHVLMLRAGRVVAAGPIAETLNAKNLSAAFGAHVRLDRRGNRWSLRLRS